MLINGIDIRTLGVKLYDRTINSNEVETTEEWLNGAIKPTFIRQQDRFKEISLSFLILNGDEDEAFLIMSKLTALLKKATIQFDDLSYTFDVTLDGSAEPSRLKNGNFIVTYSLSSDYAKGEREIYTTDATATSMFKLTVVYYQNQTTLLGTETIPIRAGAFNGENDTLASIGINVDKYKGEYYNSGVPTNMGRMALTYENLQSLNTLIINYSPIKYNLTISYWLNSGAGYSNTSDRIITFTQPQVVKATSIGQIVDAISYKPDGYRAIIDFDGELTVENILAASPIRVLYDVVENEKSKNVTVVYRNENDDGGYDIINTRVTYVTETSIVQGMVLSDIVKTNIYNPDELYYQDGSIQDHMASELITYDGLETTYTVNYRRKDSIIYVEYYAGIYPDWYRLSTIPIHTKYMTSYDDNFSIEDLNLDLNRYHTAEYQDGVLYNAGSFIDYNSVISAGVLQVYYTPIDFPLVVRYYTDEITYEEETYTINALQFFNNPVLGDLIDLTAHRPVGYQLDLTNTYSGEITLSSLTMASPITVMYEEIQQVRTKNIIVKYKQQMASMYSVVNTSLLTINEADTLGGVRLKDIININYYRPSYYDAGFLNGVSDNALLTFDELQSNYEVLYNATSYTTPVYYYTDEIDELNWVGSSVITYTVLDFAQDTTLYDLGLDVNAYKSVYSGNGEIQYNGPIQFSALRELASINILYMTEEEPADPSGIDYPHRVLFLQHNDLGSYENQHPTWTMNHAYINTGVSADDMSQVTVIMECRRVDELVPLYTVNAGYAYLFGSSSPLGQFYMRYNNQTMYGTNLSNVNTYEAKVGNTVNQLVLTEERAIGWSENSGIYAAPQLEGYSNATFTYTSRVPAEHAQMPYPIYLFANNNNGQYADGLAGIGITGCKIYVGNNLVRDFVPVQFYDKIGTQVAPSNCLYDKVTQTFFEDGTGKNSFNIIDDERYEDLNPAHQIGSCYINYCKNGVIFDSYQKYFRGDDFLNEINLYDFLMVDEHQPPYYRAGVITNLTNIAAINFDNLNNYIFNINYEALENLFEVHYYRDSVDPANLIATDIIGIEESDFYQVPTFGDIVRLNKYRPEGYKTDFVYPGAKVSLQRVMDNAPYDIVYTPITETEETYTTTIRYIKKVFGIRTYETLGTIPLTLTESQFRDGEYIEYFLDYNLMKPEEYYADGVPYEWYERDYRLDTPENLQDEYIICYMPVLANIEIRYYTDDIDPANLIATTNWGITIDEFDGEFYLVDQLPNTYVNKFKPVNCDGGILQNSDVLYTFADLMEEGHIDILYMSMAEPDDPTNEAHIGKVLYWTGAEAPTSMLHHIANDKGAGYYMINGGAIPYIDLGYTPKEIGRLKVELKGYFQASGFQANTTPYGYQSLDYTYSFGYYGALGAPKLNHHQAQTETLRLNSDMRYTTYTPKNSLASRGAFAIRGHVPTATFGTYTDLGPTGIDGERWFRTNTSNNTVTDLYDGQPKTASLTGLYRKGHYEGEDDNYENYIAYHDYSYGRGVAYSQYVSQYAETNDTTDNQALQNKWLADPITYTLDAYHSYASAYDWGNSNFMTYVNFDESADTDTFEGRCKPVGSLTLFRTRNPDTGRMNIMPFCPKTYPNISGGIGIVGFSQKDIEQMMNPFSGEWQGQVVTTVNVIGQDDFGNPITSTSTTTRNVGYSDFPCPVYPQQYMGAIWSIKIWDQDRLVRDMIPVKAGERVYDYTMPADGLFDLVTEIFFGNSNQGGTYHEKYYLSNRAGTGGMVEETITIRPDEVIPLHTVDDPCYWGNITENYYDEDNHFIANQYVSVPTWFYPGNSTLADELQYNDYKPDSYHLDGLLDTDDPDDGHNQWTLHDIYNQGLINIYYKLRTYAKSVIYYKDDYRVGSQDLFFSLKDIEDARSLADLGILANRYEDSNFKQGRLVFDDSILLNNDVAGFIDAPSPVVVYDKYTKLERPDLLYLEYYRGGAYDDAQAPIALDPTNSNYLICNLTAKVLNPSGTIKYRNHYHSALYEDEPYDYFLPYQVRVVNPYTGIHYGPARKYKTLATIATNDVYTIVEERNGWGRLREYYHGWIMLSSTEPIAGPGQNPDYDAPGDQTATIPFGEVINITKLTVDRLWAYVPAEESWVKAEEISFNQAGKLYNALDITVIDLENDVNWSTASSLADVGIYPNNRRLQYHGLCNYRYDGEYTKAAFSDIHELDFVYPETIYNYICVYYKEHKTNANELGRASFSCSVSDWNPDWDHFIETSWRYDENDNLLLPELYREAPVSLTWDYFGFNKNLYKPNGYYDGIYLWNPHPWDEEHLYFSFDELVRVGAQYVVYPEFDPHAFKYWRRGQTFNEWSRSGRKYDSDATASLDIVVETEDPMINSVNNSFYVNKTGLSDYVVPYGSTNVEIDINGYDPHTLVDQNRGMSAYNNRFYYYITNNFYNNSTVGFSVSLYTDLFEKYLDTAANTNTTERQITEEKLDKIYAANLQGMMYFEQPAIRRFYFTGSSPYANFFMASIPYHNEFEPMYALRRSTTGNLPDGMLRINSSIASFYQENNGTIASSNSYAVKPNITHGLFHGIRSYINNEIQNYYIPVPKGMWYHWDGEEKQMAHAGLFDIMTGRLLYKDPGDVIPYDLRTEYGEDPNDLVYNYFTGWTYQKITYQTPDMYKVKKALTGYQDPDVLSVAKRSLAQNLLIPVEAETSDENSRVQGEWYYTGDSWVRITLDQNESGNRLEYFDDYDILVKYKQEFVAMRDEVNNQPYHYYLSPPTNEYSIYGIHSDVITSYWRMFRGDNYYLFDGTKWYKEDETSLNTEVDFNTLALAVDYLDYYSVPIAEDAYKIGQYMAGDRIIMTDHSVRDPNWAYSSLDDCWFRIDHNFSNVEVDMGEEDEENE